MGVITKEKQLENVLNELYQVSEKFLNKYPSRKPSCLFSRRSEGRKIISSLVGLIENTKFNISFPCLSFDDENAFLKAINKIHQNILHRVNDDLLLKEFYPVFYRKFKTVIGLFFGDNNINLCYLEHYLVCREKGMNIPSHYTILKMETVSTFKAQLKMCKDNETRKILLAAIDTIQNDSRGVNFYTTNSEQRFVNMMNFLDTMRLVLSDRQEQVVLPVVTNLIERGLGVVRSDFVRGCKVKGYDYIAGEIRAMGGRINMVVLSCGMF